MSVKNVLRQVKNLDLQLPTLWYFETEDSQDAEKLSLYVQSTSLNFPSFEMQRNGNKSQYLTNYSKPTEFTMTFLEDTNFYITEWLEGWMNNIYDQNSSRFKRGDHSKTGLLTFQKPRRFTFDPTQLFPFPNVIGGIVNQYENNRQYKFEKMLILNIDSQDLDYTNTDKYTVSATFSAEKIYKAVTPQSVSTGINWESVL